jgi:hypothetical protein
MVEQALSARRDPKGRVAKPGFEKWPSILAGVTVNQAHQNEIPKQQHVARPSCADHLGGRGVGHVLAVGERRVLRAPAHPDRQQRSPRRHPVAASRLTHESGRSAAAIPGVPVKGWQKTLGAVFGLPSTAPNPRAWPL